MKKIRKKSAAGETFGELVDNPWVSPLEDWLSTFAIDVDTGSYPNVRRYLTRRAELPPKDSVRLEEMMNYFNYDYPEPTGAAAFSVTTEVAGSPWRAGNRLVRIGLRGKGIAPDKRPPSNLVFLIDVSGSMRAPEKLGLLKRSIKAMVKELNENDRIAIVTYAGSSGVALPSTSAAEQDTILAALARLRPAPSGHARETPRAADRRREIGRSRR